MGAGPQAAEGEGAGDLLRMPEVDRRHVIAIDVNLGPRIATVPGHLFRAVAKGFTDPGAFSVLQGAKLTLTCAGADTYRDDDWALNALVLTCGVNGTLDEPDTWPSCAARPTCPAPPAPESGTGLEAEDAAATPAVTQDAYFKCKVAGKVTNSGARIRASCAVNDAGSPAYVYPVGWEGAGEGDSEN